MSRLSAKTQEAARRKIPFDRKLKYIAGFAALAMIPVALPFAAVAFGLVALAGDVLADSAGDVANDPARDDYDLETRVEEPAVLWSPGDSEVERAASDLLRAAMTTAAYEEAMVTADERALGATRAGAEDYRAAREGEAVAFGTRAAELNQSLARDADAVANLLENSVGGWEPGLAVAAALRAAGQASAEYGDQYLQDHGGAIA
jgi:hypothetical protein